MNEIDQTLVQLTRTPLRTIDDVIGVFSAIGNTVPESDGLHWFNWLYLTVTKSVGDSVAAVHWHNPAWLARLDVVFAGLYLTGIRRCLTGDTEAPRCWQALMQARHDTRLARIQFAMAGMNAHINHDLPVAVVETCREMGLKPEHNSPVYQDYSQVNRLLDGLIDAAEATLMVRLLGEAIPAVDAVEDRLAGFGIATSRELAWTNAELLWRVRRMPPLSRRFTAGLDQTAGLVGRGLLVPVLPG